ncbi:Bifunctional purine biosynthesis protein PurH, partial [Coemansia biformis]
YRGTLNLLNQLSIVVGILVTLTVGMLANSGPYWRISVGFGLLLACAHLLLAPFAVESPRFLWSRNKHAEARAVLRKLRCTADVDDEVATWGATAAGPPAASSGRHCQPYAQAEPAADAAEGSSTPEVDPLQRTQTSSNGSMKPTGPVESEELRGEVASVTIFNIFRIRHYRQPWLLVLALQFGQQLSGINTVFYFSSSVLEKMFSRQVSGILTMMIGVLNVLATAAAAPVVDRFGRRPLLLSSMAAMAISVTLLGVGLGLRLNLLAAVSLYLVVASFAPGYGPVPFLLGTELFDMRAASAGGSWALAANWTGTFLVAAAFLPLLNLIGEWVFAIFVAAILICWVVFYVYVPETKGRTIDEIAMGFK